MPKPTSRSGRPFPIVTLALALAIAGAYAALSHGTLYLPDDAVRGLALHAANYPSSAVTHVFVHVGILHLAGNLLPLVLFALLVELTLGPVAVLAAFFTAAILASSAFALLNPGVFLAGASAGISGLIGAGFSARPRLATALLLASALALGLIVYPAFTALSQTQAVELTQQKQTLEANVTRLIQENKTAEAAAANQTLQQVAVQTTIVETGRARESTTPTDLSVHVIGVLVGVLYVFLFHRRAFLAGGKQIIETPAWARRKLAQVVRGTKPNQ